MKVKYNLNKIINTLLHLLKIICTFFLKLTWKTWSTAHVLHFQFSLLVYIIPFWGQAVDLTKRCGEEAIGGWRRWWEGERSVCLSINLNVGISFLKCHSWEQHVFCVGAVALFCLFRLLAISRFSKGEKCSKSFSKISFSFSITFIKFIYLLE